MRESFEDALRRLTGIEGQHTNEEAWVLFDCVLGTSPDATIVEIGTWKGKSAAIMGAACRGTKRKVFTIDNFRTDIYPQGRIFEKEVREYFARDKVEHVVLLVGDSANFALKWRRKPIDMIFIDGEHKYEAVKADIENWLPHIKKEGFMLFHDYDSHEGVKPAVDEAIGKGLLEKVKQEGTLLVTRKL